MEVEQKFENPHPSALSNLSSTGIVHANHKPDNVMAVDRQQQPLKVKLIDFGLAPAAFAPESGVCVQTRWYRAPDEPIPFNEAIDMWWGTRNMMY